MNASADDLTSSVASDGSELAGQPGREDAIDADPSDWNALSRMAAALHAECGPVTMVVGWGQTEAVIAVDEFGGEARCVCSRDFDGFVGCVTSDGTRHELANF